MDEFGLGCFSVMLRVN